MRIIQIDTDVFARIWAHRMEGEESENEILRRLLMPGRAERPSNGKDDAGHSSEPVETTGGKVRWRDDVRTALVALGGQASLADIYAKVRSLRRSRGRSLPPTTNDIIRRELENNSSASHAYTGKRDWFVPSQGIGAGIWSLRDQ